MTAVGFNEPLYILPFDHRGIVPDKMSVEGYADCGANGRDRRHQASNLRRLQSRAPGRCPARQKAGILVDEQFGAAILRDARATRLHDRCPAEKSGQEEFDFEYGDEFASAHRNVPADFLQGPGALQPRG